MKRRAFITLLGGAAAWPLAARAQQPRQVRRIGILMPYPKSDSESQSYVRAFRQELARLGWSEGGNVQFDERWSTSNMDLVRADAANLVALNPDVIVIVGDRVIPILTKLTRSIPIVVALTSDPIASGAVESLARPGRNVTGFSLIEFSIFGKMLETLKKLAPGISRVSIYSALTAAGGLVSYGPDRIAMFRQSASYVDRILRGEKPGDLPFQQPTIYRLVINLKAAKALDLTVPDTLLVAADEVIE